MSRAVEFKAPTLKQAMALARSAFGDDALILDANQIGPSSVVINAAPAGSIIDKKILISKAERLVAKKVEQSAPALQAASLFKAKESREVNPTVELLREAGFRIAVSQSLQTMSVAFGGQIKDKVLRALTFKLDELLVQSGRCPLLHTGVFCLVGPTGAGKTTTIAKLASRAVDQWGAQNVALISTDFYRIAAFEQLRVYAELLGVDLYTVQNEGELELALKETKNKSQVLIDTIGAPRKDDKVKLQMQWLGKYDFIKPLLVLPASASSTVLGEEMVYYKHHGITEIILSKIDEVADIVPAVDLMLAEKVALRLLSNGQRVPEDLHLVSSAVLAHRALKIIWKKLASYE